MKKSSLINMRESEYRVAYDAFKNYKGIITPKTSYYTSFLQKALGYIYTKCKGDENVNNVILDLISQIAEVINSSVLVDSSVAQEELKRINEVISQKDHQDVSEELLLSKLNINFATAAFDFFSTYQISKEVLIDYILTKEGVTPALENNVVSSNIVRDFVNYLASTDKQIELNAEDMTNVLCEIVATEKSAYMDSQDAYKNKYPCLTRALLLQDARKEIAELMRECSGEKVFNFYLGKLLARLSRYDIIFLKGIGVSIPYSKLSNEIYEVFLTDALVYKIAFAINPYLYMELQRVTITPKELIARIPHEFVINMRECYHSSESNAYAAKLSSIISEYCISENGKKYNAEQVRGVLDAKYGSSSKK